MMLLTGGYQQASAVRDHERIHTGEKPYKCSTCNETFRQASTLRYHERIHTGEKPYKCSTCDKTFTESGNLRRHETIHTGEKSTKSSVCDVTLRHGRGMLETNRAVEEPFVNSSSETLFNDRGSKPSVQPEVHGDCSSSVGAGAVEGSSASILRDGGRKRLIDCGADDATASARCVRSRTASVVAVDSTVCATSQMPAGRAHAGCDAASSASFAALVVNTIN